MIEIIGPALSQWDTGRSVKFTDIEADYVHFANKGDAKAVIMELVDSQAKIPDYLFQTGKQLCVYAVKDGVTVESKVFYIKTRERPENYVYEDDQRNYIYELISKAETAIEGAYSAYENANHAVEAANTAIVSANVAVENANESADSAKQAAKNANETADSAKQAAKNANETADSAKQAAKNANDAADKANHAAKDAVKTVNGIGPDENGNVEVAGGSGEPGKDGVSATHEWNGTVLTITSASGTSSADLKGADGQNGKDGADGKDYNLTEADKQEIAELTAPLVDVPGGGGSGESYIAKLQTLASGTIPNGTAAGVTDTGLTIGDLRRYKYFVLYVSSKGQNVYWGLSWKSAWGCIGRYQHASLAFTYEWKDSNKTVLEVFVGYGTGYESGVGIHDNSSSHNPLLSKMPVLITMGADSTPIYVQNGAALTVDATWEIKGCLEYES